MANCVSIHKRFTLYLQSQVFVREHIKYLAGVHLGMAPDLRLSDRDFKRLTCTDLDVLTG